MKRTRPNENNLLKWPYSTPMWKDPKEAIQWILSRPKMIWQRATTGLADGDLMFFDYTVFELLIEDIYRLRSQYESFENKDKGKLFPVCFECYSDWIAWSDVMLAQLERLMVAPEDENEYMGDLIFAYEHPDGEISKEIIKNYGVRAKEIQVEREELVRQVFTELADKISSLY